ncbi:hypothetical protein WJX72_008698 [[Myrmecia] bisecta]|uniref:Proteasome assembly chaperone 2 n=1 Tax=[Myrmecia] bisecta TaxID=41462 RepID=A0AAW1Q9U1_9CHLO
MEFFPRADLLCPLPGSTLLLPGPSAGNVGQLAIDVLICSLGATCVGQLEDVSVLPLAAWIQQSGFRQVVLLGSLEGRERRDGQLADLRTRFFASSPSLAADCPRLEDPQKEEKPYIERLAGPWPLIRQVSALQLPLLAFLQWVSEGDNSRDALEVAEAAAGYLRLPMLGAAPAQHRQWKLPPSWQSVYGRGASMDVY